MTVYKRVTETRMWVTIEQYLSPKAIEHICTQGDNEAAVLDWLNLDKPNWSRLDCICALAGYGAWEIADMLKEPLRDLQARVLWCMAWNLHDDDEQTDNIAMIEGGIFSDDPDSHWDELTKLAASEA